MPQTFHTIVFQAAPGGGNPCPVTLYADALSSEDMQAMAKAFGEESAFLLTPTLNGCDIRARYFVPLHEMEMCVHATIASTTVLAQKDIFTHSPIIFETALGAIPVYWKEKSNDPDQSLNSANQSTRTKNGCIEQTKSSKVSPIKVSIEQFLPKFANNNPSLEEVCCALAITADDIGDGPIQSVATSRFKLIVPLKDRCVLDTLKPDFKYLWDLCDRYQTTGFYPFTKEELPPKTTTITDANEQSTPRTTSVFFARQFPKRAGYPEDPATGVAASALGAYLAHHAIISTKEGWNAYPIYQGQAMNRPSPIYSEIKRENGFIAKTRVTGSAHILNQWLP